MNWLVVYCISVLMWLILITVICLAIFLMVMAVKWMFKKIRRIIHGRKN